MSELTYTWELTSLKKVTTPNVSDIVVQTYWKKTGTDSEGREGSFSGATPFDLNTIDVDAITPFEELTEEQVLSWIQAVVVDSYEVHVNEQIQKQIDEQVNTVEEVSEFPWSANTAV